MNESWAILMLISGGLFVGGVVSIAWERVPAWRQADFRDFRTGFAYTLRRVDRLQPALLTGFLVSTVAFAVNASGTARTLAVFAAVGSLIILVGSVALLVPIQRRLVIPGSAQPSKDVERLKTRWLGGHLIRTAIAVLVFITAVVAALL